MEFSVQLPGDAIERRRLQNRIAQRKFRKKRDQNRRTEVGGGVHALDACTDDLSSPAAPITGVDPQNPLQPPQSHVIPEGDAITSPTSLLSTNTQVGYGSNDPFQNASSSLDDINSWDIDAVDGFVSNEAIAPISWPTPPSPSQFLQELGPTSSSITQAATRSTARVSSPLNSSTEPAHRVEADDDGWIGGLHIAARRGNDRIVEILLEQGVDCNEKDSDGRTPLMHAVIEGNDTVVRLLLAHDAGVGLVDKDARSALHWAALHQREALLRVLVDRCGDDEAGRIAIDAYDDSGWTPLHIAIHQDFEAGVRMLLQAGASLNSKAQKCPFVRKLDSLGLL
ncbi:ankyrin repeat-containing domain protein [Hypoxylon crocopeplum]|nr:ankyrin repeat-containing domain protein [Hypoxylon crocopeplum]